MVERGEDADSLSQDAAIAAAQSDTPRDLPVEVAAPEDGYGEEELQMMMGVSLTLGFIFMLLVDQCGGGGHTHSPVTDAESTGGRHTKRKLTATIGLVVHAAGWSSLNTAAMHGLYSALLQYHSMDALIKRHFTQYCYLLVRAMGKETFF